LFGHSVTDERRGGWEIADDGGLYTLPLGSQEVQLGRVRF